MILLPPSPPSSLKTATGDLKTVMQKASPMLWRHARPIANILHNGILVISNILYLPNSVADNGDYKYGAYEKLIPLLESLGLKGVLSSQEYTARFQAAAKVSKNSAARRAVSAHRQPHRHAGG
mgnify:CR=1 FL=1